MLQHVVVIPDGNRRWARARGLHPWEGHREGFARIKELVDAAYKEDDITHLTVWLMSEDNFKKRSREEVRFLVRIIRDAIQDFGKRADERDIKLRCFGKWEELLPKSIVSKIQELTARRVARPKMHLTALLAYNGDREMLEAIRSIQQSGEAVTEQAVTKHLWTRDLPPVDLVIRTGGEPHWSNGFMMWHTRNSQFYFTETLWPDFNEHAFRAALEDIRVRERRLGA